MLGRLKRMLAFLSCIALVLAVAGKAALLVGCSRDTQEQIGDAGEEVKEAAESVGEDIKEGAEDAAEKTGEALEDLGEEMQQ